MARVFKIKNFVTKYQKVFSLVLFFGLFCFLVFGGVKRYFSENQVQSSPEKASSQDTTDEELPNFEKFGLKIAKLKISAPIVANVDAGDKNRYLSALKKGLAHYQGTPLPNAPSGNTVIFGHSSQLLQKGRYGDVFARLDELKWGDEIVIFFKKKEYSYKVKDKKVIAEDDFSILAQDQGSKVTLFTCWPPGSIAKRLVVVAEKVK